MVLMGEGRDVFDESRLPGGKKIEKVPRPIESPSQTSKKGKYLGHEKGIHGWYGGPGITSYGGGGLCTKRCTGVSRHVF